MIKYFFYISFALSAIGYIGLMGMFFVGFGVGVGAGPHWL